MQAQKGPIIEYACHEGNQAMELILGSCPAEDELHCLISLMARILYYRTLLRLHLNLSRPWFCVGTWIINCELIEEDVRSGPPKSLEHTHLLVMTLQVVPVE